MSTNSVVSREQDTKNLLKLLYLKFEDQLRLAVKSGHIDVNVQKQLLEEVNQNYQRSSPLHSQDHKYSYYARELNHGLDEIYKGYKTILDIQIYEDRSGIEKQENGVECLYFFLNSEDKREAILMRGSKYYHDDMKSYCINNLQISTVGLKSFHDKLKNSIVDNCTIELQLTEEQKTDLELHLDELLREYMGQVGNLRTNDSYISELRNLVDDETDSTAKFVDKETIERLIAKAQQLLQRRYGQQFGNKEAALPPPLPPPPPPPLPPPPNKTAVIIRQRSKSEAKNKEEDKQASLMEELKKRLKARQPPKNEFTNERPPPRMPSISRVRLTARPKSISNACIGTTAISKDYVSSALFRTID